MRQTIEDKVQDVLVGQIVEDVFSVTSAPDDIVGAQDTKALRDDRDGLTLKLSKLRDTGFALGQTCQQPNPRGLAERAEDPCGPFNSWFVDGDMKTVRGVAFGRTGGLCFSLHKTTIS